MITILSGRHAATLFRHFREYHGLTKAQLARRVFASTRTIDGREALQHGYPADALIDTAAVFGFQLALIPQRHPGARPTGTGWPT